MHSNTLGCHEYYCGINDRKYNTYCVTFIFLGIKNIKNVLYLNYFKPLTDSRFIVKKHKSFTDVKICWFRYKKKLLQLWKFVDTHVKDFYCMYSDFYI